MKKKLPIYLLLFSILYSLFSIYPSPVYGAVTQTGAALVNEAEQSYYNALQAWDERGEVSLESHTYEVLKDFELNLITAIGGTLTERETPRGEIYYHREGGALGVVGNLTASLYSNQPASSIEYLADIGASLGLAKPVYAQGLGFTALTPLLAIWKAFRNLAYLAFVIIFVIIGFMIMFRAKIDPQTVISVQNALPRIIVTLILITFSYAIAGFMMDLMNLASVLVIKIFEGQGLLKTDLGLEQKTIWELYKSIIGRFPQGAYSVIYNAVNSIFEKWPWVTKALPGFLGGLLGAVVFAVALIFGLFKTFFMLLGCYIGIIFSIIFAPFMLLFGALPGRNAVGEWIKGLVGNMIVFPTVLGVFVIGNILLGNPDWVASREGSFWGGGKTPWAPPLIGVEADIIAGLIALGIILFVPKAAETVKNTVIEKKVPFGAISAEMIRSLPLVGKRLTPG